MSDWPRPGAPPSLDVPLLNHGLPREARLLAVGQADDVALLHLQGCQRCVGEGAVCVLDLRQQLARV